MSSPSAPPAAADPASPNAVRVPTVRAATRAGDSDFIDELQAIAFGPGRFARTAFRIRERFPIDMSLSLIAEVDGTPCGSVWMTPISIGGINGYMLGPLATHPDFRKLGAGKLLAREVTARTLARGEGSFVMLVGDRDYYCPLGWEPTTLGNIEFPGPVDPERVLLFAADKSLAQTLAGPIEAFIED
ncbi:N-acetyltransferase [Devosia sp. J2-20]|uniref:N-acetyltransferase n=1 Tax=Devosia litorisediminis TaxID=2829817 RepID=A0A942I4K9_9HYPH|nr:MULTISPECIES: N-acetyltransferase [Devosia]MBS3847476.1 N-acetyltransferase [Devosia litorisediminis]MCZ4347163.1 N-acetyltransferase [Devosia neptuniae]WDQ99403.1 N-acetyltransferase [Devosia sp. J2-20]